MSISHDSGLHQAEERFIAAKTRLLSLFGSSDGSSAADSRKEAEHSQYAGRDHETTDDSPALDRYNDSSRPSTAMRANSAMHLGALPVYHGPGRDGDMLQSAEVSLILQEPKQHEGTPSSRHIYRVAGQWSESWYVDYATGKPFRAGSSKTSYEQQMGHLPDTYKGTHPADASEHLSRGTAEDRESGVVLAANQARLSASRECSLRPFDGTRIPAIPASGTKAAVAPAHLYSQPHVARKKLSKGRRHSSHSNQKSPTPGQVQRSIAHHTARSARSRPAFNLRTGPAHEKALREEMQRAEQQLRRRHALEVRRRRRLLHRMGASGRGGGLGVAATIGADSAGMGGARLTGGATRESPGTRLEAGQGRPGAAGGGRTSGNRALRRSTNKQEADLGSYGARKAPMGGRPADGHRARARSRRRSSAAACGSGTRNGPSRAGSSGPSGAGRAGYSKGPGKGTKTQGSLARAIERTGLNLHAAASLHARPPRSDELTAELQRSQGRPSSTRGSLRTGLWVPG